MTTIRLKRDNFPIYDREFSHIGKGSKPIYRPCVRVVSGETTEYYGHKLGIYRREHLTDKRRKWDYVLTDIATGRLICTAGRKIELLQAIEDNASVLKRYLDLAKGLHYAAMVEEFEKLKGATYAK